MLENSFPSTSATSSPSRAPGDARATGNRAREIDLRHRLANGDLTAAAALFDRYGGAMYAYASSLVATPANAEAIVIDAFLDATQAASGTHRELTTGLWLLGLVRAAARSRPQRCL